MAWWHRLFSRNGGTPPDEHDYYTIAFHLYSVDGKRGIEVRQRRDGQVYFIEQAWVHGTTFEDRSPGKEEGPYETLEAAEAAAVSSPWFSGRGNQTETLPGGGA
jgi:hypothetical protein